MTKRQLQTAWGAAKASGHTLTLRCACGDWSANPADYFSVGDSVVIDGPCDDCDEPFQLGYERREWVPVGVEP